MPSYHLSVKTVKRFAGRSATAAAAYRSAERIDCEREGRVHDYTRKTGVEEVFILAPADAPDWARDRGALWNAAEAAERRGNAVTAREWELALPAEITAGERARIARAFAGALVARYGVAADVAIHAPHRDGDQRNHHAHVLTSTRVLGAEGFGEKTRVLDARQTGGPEIERMRGAWAELQNDALERARVVERVDHRSLEVQRTDALSRGDALAAEGLDRAAEVKLGPAVNAIERREMRAAEAEGREYEAVTARGAQVHAARRGEVRPRTPRCGAGRASPASRTSGEPPGPDQPASVRMRRPWNSGPSHVGRGTAAGASPRAATGRGRRRPGRLTVGGWCPRDRRRSKSGRRPDAGCRGLPPLIRHGRRRAAPAAGRSRHHDSGPSCWPSCRSSLREPAPLIATQSMMATSTGYQVVADAGSAARHRCPMS